MDIYKLDIYDDAGAIEFTFSTDPTALRPYLIIPQNLAGQDVDFASGRATIGGCTVEVVDVAITPSDQDTGYLTSKLAATTGSLIGYSARIGRRAHLQAFIGGVFENVINGVIDDIELHESYSSFTLSIKDQRENERRTQAFVSATTSAVIPRGVVDGFGFIAASSSWLAPPVTPLRATVGTTTGIITHSELTFPVLSRDSSGRQVADNAVDRIVTPKMRELFGVSATTAGTMSVQAPYIRILWRTAGSSGPYNIIDPVGGLLLEKILRTSAGIYKGKVVEVLDALQFDWLTAPANGTQLDVIVGYNGPPSKDYPLHIETTFGILLKRLYDGVYSDPSAGISIQYDETAVLALTEPCRARITEPLNSEDGIWKWVEDNIYAPLQAAPALDSQGRISPIRSRLPDVAEVLLQLDDTNCEPSPGWSHSGSDAINVVSVEYSRLYAIPSDSDPLGEQASGDGLAERKITVEHKHLGSIAFVGEKPLKIKAVTLTAVGGVEGEAVSGDVADEIGAQIAARTAREATDRFLLGGQHFQVRVMRSALGNRRVGSWCVVAHSWMPEYATGQRGANRLAQIVSIAPTDSQWSDVHLIDAGPNNVPVGVPTLGTLTVNSEGAVSIPVTVVPAGADARVDYAVNATQPSVDSSLWRFAGRVSAASTVTTPSNPLGTTVWVRSRGEKEGRRPSAWTSAVSIAVPIVARVTNVRLTINDETGGATVTWTPNGYTHGVRIYSDAHLPILIPSLDTTVDVDADLGSYIFASGSVGAAELLTVDVEPWTGWTGTAVSGTAGSKVRVSASRLDSQGVALQIFDVKVVAQTATTLTWRATAGARVFSVFIYDKLDIPIAATDVPIMHVNPDADRYVYYSAVIPAETHHRNLMFVPFTQDWIQGLPWLTTIHPKPDQAPVIMQDVSDDGEVGSYWISIQTRGIPYNSVLVQTQVGVAPLSPLGSSYRRYPNPSVVKGGLLGPDDYEMDIVLDSYRSSRIFFHIGLATGETVTVESPGFDQNRVPDFVAEPVVLGSTITINGDDDTISFKVERVGGGTWVRQIDNWTGVVDVSLVDDTGNAGQANNTTVLYRITLRSDPTSDVDASTFTEIREVTVTRGTATTPVWDNVQTLPPALSSSAMTIKLDSSSPNVGYTGKVWYRSQFGGFAFSDWSDITASLSPALSSPPPTALTSYTYATGYPRVAKSGVALIVTVEVRAELLSAGVVVASRTESTNWYALAA